MWKLKKFGWRGFGEDGYEHDYERFENVKMSMKV
jgi:hypothetical protein